MRHSFRMIDAMHALLACCVLWSACTKPPEAAPQQPRAATSPTATATEGAGPQDPRAPATQPAQWQFVNTSREATYVGSVTILGRDPVTGDLGVAMLSNCPGIFGQLLAASAEVGVAVTAAKPNTTWPAAALARLREGDSAEQALASVLESDPSARIRQLAILAPKGKGAVHSGDGVLSVQETAVGEDCVLFGSLMVPRPVLPAAKAAFEAAAGLPLPERLLLALGAASNLVEDEKLPKPGGLIRSHRTCAAALVVVRAGGGYDGRTDRFVDLRIDYHLDVVTALEQAYIAWVAAVIVPRLRDLQKAIQDTKSPIYKSNAEWLMRIRRRVGIGVRGG